MINPGDATQLIGATAYSSDGEKIGRIGTVYFDDRTGEAAWASVSTGLFGLRESLAPLDGADFDGSDVHLTFSKDRIKDAPNVDPDGDRILESDERELYSFYDLDYGPEAYASGTTADEGYAGFGSSGSWNASSREGGQAFGTAEDAQLDPATTGSGDAAPAYDPATVGSGDAVPAYDPATTDSAGPPPDADTIERMERTADAAEQRFRVRLRRYLADPSIATLPVSEQAEVEDAAVAEGVQQDTTPTAERLM